jgi:hypothetical protein
VSLLLCTLNQWLDILNQAMPHKHLNRAMSLNQDMLLNRVMSLNQDMLLNQAILLNQDMLLNQASLVCHQFQ